MNPVKRYENTLALAVLILPHDVRACFKTQDSGGTGHGLFRHATRLLGFFAANCLLVAQVRSWCLPPEF